MTGFHARQGAIHPSLGVGVVGYDTRGALSIAHTSGTGHLTVTQDPRGWEPSMDVVRPGSVQIMVLDLDLRLADDRLRAGGRAAKALGITYPQFVRDAGGVTWLYDPIIERYKPINADGQWILPEHLSMTRGPLMEISSSQA